MAVSVHQSRHKHSLPHVAYRRLRKLRTDSLQGSDRGDPIAVDTDGAILDRRAIGLHGQNNVAGDNRTTHVVSSRFELRTRSVPHRTWHPCESFKPRSAAIGHRI